MAKLLQKNGDGHLLKNTGGHIANECAGNPCDPKPEMLCTVTGATGTINWLGETWTLPGDSGTQKSVCPHTWYCAKSNWGDNECVWKYRNPILTSPSGDLHLRHYYEEGACASCTTGGYVTYLDSMQQLIQIRTSGQAIAFDNASAYGEPTGGGPPVWSYNYNTSQMGILAADRWALTRNNYNLSNFSYFGSHTIGGITYAWAKGAGW
jgi:hypothetical protein